MEKKIIHREPQIIEEEIINLQKELIASKKHYKIPPPDEYLRIPYEYKKFFPNKDFYDNGIQKLAWEEDD